jgi:hypothetical protein
VVSTAAWVVGVDVRVVGREATWVVGWYTPGSGGGSSRLSLSRQAVSGSASSATSSPAAIRATAARHGSASLARSMIVVGFIIRVLNRCGELDVAREGALRTGDAFQGVQSMARQRGTVVPLEPGGCRGGVGTGRRSRPKRRHLDTSRVAQPTEAAPDAWNHRSKTTPPHRICGPQDGFSDEDQHRIRRQRNNSRRLCGR